MFGCKNLGLSECRATKALKRLGLYEYREYPPYKLSTGGKTRLSIASALAVDPDIIILDEPTTGQDKSTLEILKNIILSFSLLILLLIITAVITFTVDPMQHYRKAKFYKPYALEQRYIIWGMLKNYSFDTILIGSSVTENFTKSYHAHF